MRNQFRKNTPLVLSALQDRYDFYQSVDQTVLENMGHIQKTVQKKYSNAFRLMEVTHNVNFKGQFVFDHYNFYQCPEQKYLTLKNLLEKQKQNFEKKYQISKYIHNQVRFCIAVVSYNNAKKNRLYLRNLDSIFQQDYKNYHVVYVDDASTDDTGYYAQMYMEQNKIPKQMYTLIKNKQSMGGSYNIQNIANNYCKEGQILAFVDGDDSLIGRQVLSMMNAFYQINKVALTFGRLIKFNSTNYWKDWAFQPKIQDIRSGSYRRQYYFSNIHLKTIHVDLFRKLLSQDFKFKNGSYFRQSTDTAFMIPAIQMVQQRGKLVDEVIVQYSVGGDNHENLPKQRRAHDQVRFNKPQKQRLEDFSFADNLKTTYYP